jgi:hypothetical protein
VSAFLDTPAGALSYYEDVGNPLEAAKTAVYTTVTMTGDFFMVKLFPYSYSLFQFGLLYLRFTAVSWYGIGSGSL